MYAYRDRFIFHEKKTTTTKQSVNSLFIPPAFMPRGIQFSPFRSSIRVFVRSCVLHIRGIYHKFFTELRNSFSRGVYLMNQSSESIHIWTIQVSTAIQIIKRNIIFIFLDTFCLLFIIFVGLQLKEIFHIPHKLLGITGFSKKLVK